MSFLFLNLAVLVAELLFPLVDFLQQAVHLNSQKSEELLLGGDVLDVVLSTERFGQTFRGVTIANYDPLRLRRSKVDIYEKKGLPQVDHVGGGQLMNLLDYFIQG